MLQMDRQLRQVSVAAGQDDLLDRRRRGGHFDRSEWMVQPFAQDGSKVCLIRIEPQCEPPPSAHDVADKFGALGADGAEPDRFGIAVQDSSDIDEIDGCIVHEALALLHELFDKATETKSFGIGLAHYDALSQ
jgi:hypothetical protein